MSDYAIAQWAHDRIDAARTAARVHALTRELAPHRGWYTVALGLIRLGGWVLASAIRRPIEAARSLGASSDGRPFLPGSTTVKRKERRRMTTTFHTAVHETTPMERTFAMYHEIIPIPVR